MSTRQERADFIADTIHPDLLDDAIQWIKTHLSPGEVFDDSQLIDWAHENDMHTLGETASDFQPDEVFQQHQLRDWAEGVGYVEEQ
jgi:diadenosine tetraphosphatase ApaH/serine/threonine PP2A family protein phosphatase